MTQAGDAILVVNAGSSSVKLAAFARTGGDAPLLSAAIERIGAPDAAARLTDSNGARHALALPADAGLRHDTALATVLPALAAEAGAPAAVGHRIVHGGPDFAASARVNDLVIQRLRALIPLARTHQPHGLAAIAACARLWPDLPQIACFDTAFHRTIPDAARVIALPKAVRDAGVARYGFHGLSYRWIAQTLSAEVHAGRVVAAHLGNGASLCGMVDGVSRATTMGFTPLDGLVMGERPGLTDPGAVLFMVEELGMDAAALRRALFHDSGLKGLSGLSNDMRALEASDAPEAALALAVYVHRAVREIGAMAAEIGGLDALVFTGGVGENAAAMRAAIVGRLGWLGLTLDADANAAHAPVLSVPGSKPVLIVAANEEAMIAADVRAALDP